MRIQYRSDGKGHLLIRADGDDVEGVGPRFVQAHRLAAIAWGELDSLDDPREVDHLDSVPCHNAQENLDAVDDATHGRRTRERAAERRASA
jgi:hypothetical protein